MIEVRLREACLHCRYLDLKTDKEAVFCDGEIVNNVFISCNHLPICEKYAKSGELKINEVL